MPFYLSPRCSTPPRHYSRPTSKLDVTFSQDEFGESPTAESISSANYNGLVKSSLRELFPDVKKRKQKKALYRLASGGAEYEIRDLISENPQWIGTTQSIWLLADDEVDMFVKGKVSREISETKRRLKDNAIEWIDQLTAQGRIDKRFNVPFFTAGDSREPEQAGIRGAAMGFSLHHYCCDVAFISYRRRRRHLPGRVRAKKTESPD